MWFSGEILFSMLDDDDDSLITDLFQRRTKNSTHVRKKNKMLKMSRKYLEKNPRLFSEKKKNGIKLTTEGINQLFSVASFKTVFCPS